MRILLIALLLFYLSSCKKAEPTGEYSVLVGLYEWSYSEHWHYNDYGIWTAKIFEYAIDSPDKYGIEITEKGRVFLYKNRKCVERFRIKKLSSDPYQVIYVDLTKKYNFQYKNNQISSIDFPYDNENRNDNVIHYNTFIKK